MRRLRTVLLLGCLLLPCGCAYTIVDNDGTKHIIGLAKIDIPPQSKQSLVVGESVSVKTFGISISKTIIGGGVSLGYSDEAITTLFGETLIVDEGTAAYIYENMCLDKNKGGKK